MVAAGAPSPSAGRKASEAPVAGRVPERAPRLERRGVLVEADVAQLRRREAGEGAPLPRDATPEAEAGDEGGEAPALKDGRVEGAIVGVDGHGGFRCFA